MAESDGHGRLVLDGGQVRLDTVDGVRDVPAIEIFKAVARGQSTVAGIALAEPPSKSLNHINFHLQPASTFLWLRDGHGGPVTSASAIRKGGELIPASPTLDHLVAGQDWFPLDTVSQEQVEEWISNNSPLTLGGYLDLYRGLDPPFEIADELSDEAITAMAGDWLPPPAGLAPYPYQTVGFRWLMAHALAGKGGILADEMGLGKTLQAILLIEQRRKSGFRPALVVVPLTLVESWAREIARIISDASVYRHLGAHRIRRPTEIVKADITLTTYDTAVMDQAVLELVPWDIVIADEAQFIKNHETQRHQALVSLPRQAGFALTGTPLQNRTSEVWAISQFALPDYLGSRDQFGTVLENDPQLLSRALRPIMLRREVAEVADDLPARIDIDVALEMFDPEAAAYDDLIRSSQQSGSRSAPLGLLTRLRLFTAHPHAAGYLAGTPRIDSSAKLARFVEIAEEIVAEGGKALVFVAFQRPADFLAEVISERLGAPAWVIDGRTPARERQPTVDRFSEMPGSAMLVLNPAAAGIGLNIQAASHVVHFTLEWNPAKEDQATARAWRRGQRVPVTVHRLYYIDTIDEAILGLLQSKRRLIDEVVKPTATEDQDVRTLVEMAITQRSLRLTREENRA
jgi:SNF2 family DNA or RNA helicase